MVMMETLEIRELLVTALNRYGRIRFLVVWFFITVVVAGVAYFGGIKPLYDDIHLYQSTIDQVRVLEKKFGTVLHENQLAQTQTISDKKTRTESVADMAFIIDRALDYGLIIESSIRQSQDNHEQHILKLSGTFEMFMRFLENIGGFGAALNNVVVTATQQGVVAQLTFSNESMEEQA